MKQRRNQKNSGVCCDVISCVHNCRGCDCDCDKIRVSEGYDSSHHFCKSYQCKDEDCSCTDCPNK